MEKRRVAALDAGRSIAIAGVVAVHLSFQFPNLPKSVALIAVRLYVVLNRPACSEPNVALPALYECAPAPASRPPSTIRAIA
jgi:hypothetical protein